MFEISGWRWGAASCDALRAPMKTTLPERDPSFYFYLIQHLATVVTGIFSMPYGLKYSALKSNGVIYTNVFFIKYDTCFVFRMIVIVGPSVVIQCC